MAQAVKEGWSTTRVIGPVRVNFVQMTPAAADVKQTTDGEDYKKYSMQCLFPAVCDPLARTLAEMCEEAVISKFVAMDKAPTNLKKPVKLGDTEKDTKEFPFYIGQKYFSVTHNAYAKKPAPPAIIDRNGQVGMDEDPPEGGSFAMVKIVAKTYTGQGYQPGVSFRIKAVQPISLAEATKRFAAQGYTGELDDSPLGGSDGPADDGFGSVDGGAAKSENYQEPAAETGGMSFMD